MSDKIIAAKLTVDATQANAAIKETNKNAGDLNTTLGETKKTASETGGAVEGSSTSFGKLRGQMEGLPGPLGQATSGVGKLSTAFKALLANPVGLILAAIVATLALLYKAFTNTFAGAQKVEQIFAGLKAAGQALLDNLGKIASAIVKLFTFDFSGAVAEIAQVTAAAADAYTQMSKLTEEAQKLHREQLSNDLDAAKRAKELAELRAKANDEDVKPEERLAALKELREAAVKNAQEDIDLAKRVADNKIAQLTLEKDGELKNADEINEIKIQQIQVETDNANELRSIQKQITQAEKQNLQDRLAEQKAAAEKRAEIAQKAVERQKQIEDAGNRAILEAQKVLDSQLDRDGQLDKLKNEYEQKIEAAQKAGKQFLKVREAYLIERNELEEKFRQEDEQKQKDADQAKADFLTLIGDRKAQEIADDVKRATEAQKAKEELDAKEKESKERSTAGIAGALGTLSEIAGKQTVLGKALAIASATISTYQSAIAAFRGMVTTIPGPVGIALGAVAAAGALATGIATVKKIVAVKVPGGGGGGEGSGISAPATPAAPIAPTQQSTKIDQSSITGVGNAAAGGINAASRTYVLDSDIQDNAERNSRLSRAARLGG